MNTISALFIATSLQFNLPQDLLSSLCYVESKHDINAVHHDDGGSNSIGICQVKLKTAQWLGFKGTEQQLMEPSVNIYYAGKYLSYQLARYNCPKKAVIAYNIGNARQLTSTKYQVRVFKQWGMNARYQY